MHCCHCPFAKLSLMKSMLHGSFGICAAGYDRPQGVRAFRADLGADPESFETIQAIRPRKVHMSPSRCKSACNRR